MTRALTILSTLLLSLTLLIATPQPAEATCHDANFSPATYEVNEKAGEVIVRVMLGNGHRPQGGPPQGCTGSVQYTTENGTAQEGADFVHTSGTLSFNQFDDHEETIRISLIDDRAIEPDEAFTVKLTSCVGSITVCNSQAVVTIKDNDPQSPPPAPGEVFAENSSSSVQANEPAVSASPQAAAPAQAPAVAASEAPPPLKRGPRVLRAVVAQHEEAEGPRTSLWKLIGLSILLLGAIALAISKVRAGARATK